MIELITGPGFRVMTIGALITQFVFMNIVIFVAINTGGQGIPEFFLLLMAIVTFNLQVFTQ